jgi:hypothetical protein
MSQPSMSLIIHHHRAAALLFVAGVMSMPARAQELEPRAYANTPIGLNFLIAGYGYSEGGVVPDPSIPLENADIRIHSGVLAYARSFEAWGSSAKFDAVLPYASLSGTADVAGQPRSRDVSGWGDARLRASINLYGAPALSLQDIPNYRQDLIIGASVQVWAPIGQYEADKIINIGANRWTLKPEIGLSKTFGAWIIELAAAVAVFEDNDEFATDRRREQDPLYSVQGGVIYSFGSGIWFALGATYYAGGRTTVEGVRNNDLQENSRFGLIVTIPVNRYNSLKMYANTGIATRIGSDFDAIGLAWQHRWGGGL